MKKVSRISKVLLYIEMLPLSLLAFLSFILILSTSGILSKLIMLLSFLSVISLMNIILKIMTNDHEKICRKSIYLAHIGFLITMMGVVVLLIDGNGFKSHSSHFPYSGYSVGLIACIPYFHVMISNNFFRKS